MCIQKAQNKTKHFNFTWTLKCLFIYSVMPADRYKTVTLLSVVRLFKDLVLCILRSVGMRVTSAPGRRDAAGPG